MNKNYYRGKPLNSKEPWVYGAYYEHQPPLVCIGEQKEKPKSYIVRTAFGDWNMPRQVEHVPIEEGSQGQYLGINAKWSYRGEKEEDLMIFEGDIVEFASTEGETYRKEIIWDDRSLCYLLGNFSYEKLFESQYFNPPNNFRIIGSALEGVKISE